MHVPGVVMAFGGATPAALAKASAISRLLSLLPSSISQVKERRLLLLLPLHHLYQKQHITTSCQKDHSSPTQKVNKSTTPSQWYVTHKTLHRPFPFVVQPHKASQYPRRLQTQIIIVVVVLSARPPSTTTTSRPHSFKNHPSTLPTNHSLLQSLPPLTQHVRPTGAKHKLQGGLLPLRQAR